MGRKKVNKIYSMFKYNEETKQSLCLEKGCNQYIKGNHGGNLMRHFYAQHREKHDEIVKSNLENKEKLSSENFTAVMEHCIALVTVHGRPFDIIEDEAFRQIIKLVPGITAKELQDINVRNIKEIIRKRYEFKTQDVTSLLSQFDGRQSPSPEPDEIYVSVKEENVY